MDVRPQARNFQRLKDGDSCKGLISKDGEMEKAFFGIARIYREGTTGKTDHTPTGKRPDRPHAFWLKSATATGCSIVAAFQPKCYPPYACPGTTDFTTLLGDKMTRQFLTRLAMTLMVVIGLSTSLHPQTSLGQISGVVTDTTGAIIPGAAITITNGGTGAIRTATSDDNARFMTTHLPIGDYSVAVQKDGYGPARPNGLSF